MPSCAFRDHVTGPDSLQWVSTTRSTPATRTACPTHRHNRSEAAQSQRRGRLYACSAGFLGVGFGVVVPLLANSCGDTPDLHQEGGARNSVTPPSLALN